MISTHGLSAPTRVSAIVRMALAHAFLDTMELLANDLCARVIVIIEELVGLRNISLNTLLARTKSLGTLSKP
jgi:hypothetical protein